MRSRVRIMINKVFKILVKFVVYKGVNEKICWWVCNDEDYVNIVKNL